MSTPADAVTSGGVVRTRPERGYRPGTAGPARGRCRVLGATAAAAALALPEGCWAQTLREVLGAGLFLENWQLADDSVDHAARNSLASVVQHVWSLSIQGQVLLLWPVLVALVAIIVRRGGIRLRSALTLAMAGIPGDAPQPGALALTSGGVDAAPLLPAPITMYETGCASSTGTAFQMTRFPMDRCTEPVGYTPTIRHVVVGDSDAQQLTGALIAMATEQHDKDMPPSDTFVDIADAVCGPTFCAPRSETTWSSSAQPPHRHRYRRPRFLTTS